LRSFLVTIVGQGGDEPMAWLLLLGEAQIFRNVRRALSQLYQHARMGRLEPPVIVIASDDDFLAQRVARRLTDLLLPTEERETALTVLNGREISEEQIADALLTPTFGLEVHKRRVVLIQNASVSGERTGRRRSKGSEWWRCLRQIPPDTFVLITFPQMPTQSVLDALNEIALIVPVPKLRPQDLPEFVQMLAEQVGIRLTQDAVNELIERVGNDARQLASELEKLALVVGGDGRVTADMVRELVPSLAMDVFTLVNAVTKGDAATALKVLNDLLQRREPPMKILGLLARQFRFLLQARLLLDAKLFSPALLRARPDIFRQQLDRLPEEVRRRLPENPRYNLLQQSPQAIRTFLLQAGEFSRTQLEQALRLILETDIGLKSGVDQGQQMALLVLQLCVSVQGGKRV
jgi:DNA polymerase-3 subunit delta